MKEIVTQEQLEALIERQRRMPPMRLGDALLKEGAISENQLQQALGMQAQTHKQLGSILIDMGYVTEAVVNRILAQKLGIPFISLKHFHFDPDLLSSMPIKLMRQYNVMPLFRSANRLLVAMENPFAEVQLQELSFAVHMKVEPVMASSEELRAAVLHHYGEEGASEDLQALVDELHISRDAPAALMQEKLVGESDNTLVRLVNTIIIEAHKEGASDIHIETGKEDKPARIRFRQDGIMRFYSEVPAAYQSALISRIKIMASLDISERRQPQDGKINFDDGDGSPIELRVVTIPTTEGMEDVVMRILTLPTAMQLDQLDLNSSVLQRLRTLAAKPYGLLLVCGPTGSGKTTTLHALLSHINTPEQKIWTVEDPVEITQEGLRQVQVQEKTGWTFPAVLRSFLRADPDIIMVGEMRDAETAKTVIEASLTGHLVLSTLHTNSAVESVVRLLDLGMDPFNFSDALLGILGQRLVRRLCHACRTSYTISEDELSMLAEAYSSETGGNAGHTVKEWKSHYANAAGEVTLYKPCGCSHCGQSGYKGRIGVFELLVNSPALKRKIYGKASTPELMAVSVSEGLKTIRQDGIEKMLGGETDWRQIRRL
jgi:type II secretory ATPase GspE/PulE/Tfp pilus assembly ATPase PilB-like protein